VAGFVSAAVGTSSEDLVEEAPEVERREWSGGTSRIWSAGLSVAGVGGIWLAAEVEERERERREEGGGAVRLGARVWDWGFGFVWG
jgi:hypothetical protein